VFADFSTLASQNGRMYRNGKVYFTFRRPAFADETAEDAIPAGSSYPTTTFQVRPKPSECDPHQA